MANPRGNDGKQRPWSIAVTLASYLKAFSDSACESQWGATQFSVEIVHRHQGALA